MQPALNDATTALLRAIRLRLEPYGRLVLEDVRSRGWASVTFTGARHELTLRVEGERADEGADIFAAGLGAAEFELRGHIVADIALVSQEREPGRVRLSLEALTVEDG